MCLDKTLEWVWSVTKAPRNSRCFTLGHREDNPLTLDIPILNIENIYRDLQMVLEKKCPAKSYHLKAVLDRGRSSKHGHWNTERGHYKTTPV